MSLRNYLISGVAIALIAIGFTAGYKVYPVVHPFPVITTDTVEILDTNWYSIEDSLELEINKLQQKVDYWKHHRDTVRLPGDTIPIPADVDTAAILRDYYTPYKYGWEVKDSNIVASDSTIITQNTPVWHKFTYKLLKPQTTIVNNVDNSVTYSSYLQLGMSLPVYSYSDSAKANVYDLSLEATYSFPKGYLGAGWQPNREVLAVRFGTTIAKFKKKK